LALKKKKVMGGWMMESSIKAYAVIRMIKPGG
jgi:hypothetical protein